MSIFNLFDFFKHKQRIAERVPMNIMFSYKCDNRDYMGLLKDISVNGIGFSSSSYVEPGKEITIEVVIESKDPEVDLKWAALEERAVVKWSGVNHSSKLIDYDVGCEFIESAYTADNENRRKLTQMLNQIVQKSKR